MNDRQNAIAKTLNVQQQEHVNPLENRSNIRKALHVGKRAVQSAVVVAELLPTNEAIRYGAFAASQVATGGDPVLGAAVLGGSTFVVEGTAAMAASSLVTSDKGLSSIGKINERLEDIVPPDAKLTPLTEAGIALFGGSAVLTMAKQKQEPYRTTKENRKYGIFTASWMSGVFAVEGALLSYGISSYTDPKKIGPALLAVSGTWALSKRAQRKLKDESSQLGDRDYPESIVEFSEESKISEKNIWSSYHKYSRNRKKQDKNVKIGLFGEELYESLVSQDSTLVKYKTKSGEELWMPVFVPAENMQWNNMECINSRINLKGNALYYAHPPVPSGYEELVELRKLFEEKLEDGYSILVDYYEDKRGAEDIGTELLFDLATSNEDFVIDSFDSNGEKKSSEVFVAEVSFNNSQKIKKSPKTMTQIFREMVKKGELNQDVDNGVSVADKIDKSQHERLWQVYKAPFDALSEDHPAVSGYDKETFIKLLEDPEVIKILNKVGGEVTTLCIFVQDFDHCPWFNKKFYKDEYPKYFKTKNILIFPGIVSDEKMKGSKYASKVIDLATKLLAVRGTDILVTFECTETSAKYIPKIVKKAVENSGVANVSDRINEPQSTTRYALISRRQ